MKTAPSGASLLYNHFSKPPAEGDKHTHHVRPQRCVQCLTHSVVNYRIHVKHDKTESHPP